MKFATLVISAGLLAAPAFADSCSSKKDATHRVDASYTTAIAGEGYTKAKADIVDTAAAAGSFSTLLAAAEAAGLVGALKGDGPLTVFAPTDEAFAALPAGTVESLLKPENKDQLIAVLTYHVVPGKVSSTQVVELNSATTVNGQDIVIRVDGGSVMFDNATVAKADIMASNGVIFRSAPAGLGPAVSSAFSIENEVFPDPQINGPRNLAATFAALPGVGPAVTLTYQ